MNTTMRPPGPVGVALLRNKDLREHGDIQDGERTGSRMSLVHSTHLQPVPFPQGCWAVGAWDGAGPIPQLLSGFGSRLFSWEEVERGGKQRCQGWKGQKQIWGFLQPPHLLQPHSHGFSSSTQTQHGGFPWEVCSSNPSCPQGEITEHPQSIRGRNQL